jgi:hypothetical protein
MRFMVFSVLKVLASSPWQAWESSNGCAVSLSWRSGIGWRYCGGAAPTDLLVLDADPLADIGATRQIRIVVSRGEVHDRARLDRMLEKVRRKVAEKQ